MNIGLCIFLFAAFDYDFADVDMANGDEPDDEDGILQSNRIVLQKLERELSLADRPQNHGTDDAAKSNQVEDNLFEDNVFAQLCRNTKGRESEWSQLLKINHVRYSRASMVGTKRSSWINGSLLTVGWFFVHLFIIRRIPKDLFVFLLVFTLCVMSICVLFAEDADASLLIEMPVKQRGLFGKRAREMVGRLTEAVEKADEKLPVPPPVVSSTSLPKKVSTDLL